MPEEVSGKVILACGGALLLMLVIVGVSSNIKSNTSSGIQPTILATPNQPSASTQPAAPVTSVQPPVPAPQTPPQRWPDGSPGPALSQNQNPGAAPGTPDQNPGAAPGTPPVTYVPQPSPSYQAQREQPNPEQIQADQMLQFSYASGNALYAASQSGMAAGGPAGCAQALRQEANFIRTNASNGFAFRQEQYGQEAQTLENEADRLDPGSSGNGM